MSKFENENQNTNIEEVLAEQARGKAVKGFYEGVTERLIEEAQGDRREKEALSEEAKALQSRIVELKYEAEHDELTKLLNRKGFEHILAEIRKAGVGGALLFLDIDHFKQYNDTAGHGVGDLILKAVARRLEKISRESDAVARWGGDGFILFFPGTTADQILQKFKSEKQGVSSIHIHFVGVGGQGIDITFSGGVTDLGVRDDFDEAVERADKKLYDIKETGRGRLEIMNDK
jgi:diguanylate cyclase (GGDEF)-like protein